MYVSKRVGKQVLLSFFIMYIIVQINTLQTGSTHLIKLFVSPSEHLFYIGCDA